MILITITVDWLNKIVCLSTTVVKVERTSIYLFILTFNGLVFIIKAFHFLNNQSWKTFLILNF